MKNILLSIPEKQYPFIMELVRSFDYLKVKKIKEDSTSNYLTVKEIKEDSASTKQEFMDGMRNAIAEVKLIKAGKKKGKPFQQLLDEL